MRIDIIVPNFDETSDEVTLSAWYKSVGEKVSKGEVIADAETSTIACGITSSYDCILAKILVREGETISQGTKIAVIETDLSADVSDIVKKDAREEALDLSREIDAQIKQEAEAASAKIANEMRKEMKESQDELKKEETALLKHEEERADNRKHLRESLDLDDESSGDESGYTLSVPLDDVKKRTEDLVSGTSGYRKADERAIVNEIARDSEKIEGQIIDDFSNQAEQKVKSMLKDAENQARAEAEKLKQSILADAQKQATAEGDALKAKILKEYEDKAVKDANEMHQRIIQGSVTEAETTKSKLIEDAKEKAQKEAEEIRKAILKEAENAAKDMAETIKKEELAKAKKDAEEKAEALTKEIMEKAISESKSDARAVKKDILHSAHKHIAKEAENIIRSARKEAQILSEARIKELMSIVMMFAEKEAAAIKNEVIQNKNKIAEAAKVTEQEIYKLREELAHSGLQARGLLTSAMHLAETEAQEVKKNMSQSEDQIQNIINDAINIANDKADQLEGTILDEVKTITQKRASEMLTTTFASLQQNISDMEALILDQAKVITEEKSRVEKAQEEASAMRCELDLNRAKIEQATQNTTEEVCKLKEELMHSGLHARSLLASAINLAEAEVRDVQKNIEQSKDEVQKIVHGELLLNKQKISEAAKVTEQGIYKLREELMRSESHAKGMLTSMVDFAEAEVREIKKDIAQSEEQIREIINEAIMLASNKAGQLEATILNEAKHIAQKRANEMLATTLASLEQDINDLKRDVLEETKKIAVEQAKEVIDETNRVVLDNVCQMKDIMSKSTQTVVQDSVSSIMDSVKESVLEELKKEAQNEGEKEEPASDSSTAEDNETTAAVGQQDDIVHKLMNITENEGGTPDMYPNNWNKPQFLANPTDENEEIDLIRRRMSERRTDAYDASVISTVSNEVDMSTVITLEKNFGAQFLEKYNVRLGFTPFFIKAAVDALKRYKTFNAHVHDKQILYKENFDISVIIYGNDGVSAPVIRQADKMSFAEIEKAMLALSKRALDGTLSVEEVSEGTFTVINAGIYGSVMGTDLLTPPQVATLSVHKMRNKPVATDGGVEVRPVLNISLSYDHRVSDTKLASEFLTHIKQFVENPGWQILGLGE